LILECYGRPEWTADSVAKIQNCFGYSKVKSSFLVENVMNNRLKAYANVKISEPCGSLYVKILSAKLN